MASNIIKLYNENKKNTTEETLILNYNNFKKDSKDNNQKTNEIDYIEYIVNNTDSDDNMNNEKIYKNNNELDILNNNMKSNIVIPKRKIFKNYEKSIESKQIKKLLCFNILHHGSCPYESKCIYAHNMSEQNVDNDRKLAYYYIINDIDMSDIDLIRNKTLINSFTQLCSVCEMCLNHSCPGGYNCKYGVFSKKYQICKNDLITGKCFNLNCERVHLTNKGLIPYNVQIYNKKKIRDNISNLHNDELAEAKPNINRFKKKNKKMLNNCIRLTDDYFIENDKSSYNIYDKSNDILEDNFNESISDNEVNNIINIMND